METTSEELRALARRDVATPVDAGNDARLQQVKRSYDPDNLFRHNQNIAPTTVG